MNESVNHPLKSALGEAGLHMWTPSALLGLKWLLLRLRAITLQHLEQNVFNKRPALRDILRGAATVRPSIRRSPVDVQDQKTLTGEQMRRSPASQANEVVATRSWKLPWRRQGTAIALHHYSCLWSQLKRSKAARPHLPNGVSHGISALQ